VVKAFTKEMSDNFDIERSMQVPLYTDGTPRGRTRALTTDEMKVIKDEITKHIKNPTDFKIDSISQRIKIDRKTLSIIRDRMLLYETCFRYTPADMRQEDDTPIEVPSIDLNSASEVSIKETLEFYAIMMRDPDVPGNTRLRAAQENLRAQMLLDQQRHIGPPDPLTSEEKIKRVVRMLECCTEAEVREACRIYFDEILPNEIAAFKLLKKVTH